jgi:hypothetical protein
MSTPDRLETLMLELGFHFDSLGDGLWLIHDEADHLDNVVLQLADPVVMLRVKLFELGSGNNSALFQRLLELNATDMLHGAYGLDGDAVILIDSLEVENLDGNELQASIDAMSLALTQHYPLLKDMRSTEAGE